MLFIIIEIQLLLENFKKILINSNYIIYIKFLHFFSIFFIILLINLQITLTLIFI